MLGGMVSSACGSLRSLDAFNEDPDLADDTFLLVGRVPLITHCAERAQWLLAGSCRFDGILC